MFCFLRLIGSVLLAMVPLGMCWAAGPHAAAPEMCPEVISGENQSKAVLSGSAFIIAAAALEEQGKGNITPSYDEPESICTVESFQWNGADVTASHSKFKAGMRTLLYRFAADAGDGKREILVLYSGMVSLVQGGGMHFYLSETRAGRTGIYAMYEGEPSYGVVKSLVQQILDGSADPLIAVEWPEDSDELAIVVFDGDRLTD